MSPSSTSDVACRGADDSYTFLPPVGVGTTNPLGGFSVRGRGGRGLSTDPARGAYRNPTSGLGGWTPLKAALTATMPSPEAKSPVHAFQR